MIGEKGQRRVLRVKWGAGSGGAEDGKLPFRLAVCGGAWREKGLEFAKAFKSFSVCKYSVSVSLLSIRCAYRRFRPW